MDIGRNSPVAGPTPAKTEWKSNVAGPTKSAANTPGTESFGAQLNRIAGAAPEGRNLYENKNEMSKEAYLKMVMSQLQYQDPLNPTKNEQFSQQMTMLSQLEQQVNMNKTLEKFVNQQNNVQLQALQLVGKSIAADRATLYHDQDKSSPLQFKLPQDADVLKVRIENAATGETIRTVDLGGRQSGDISTKWDGLQDNGQPAPSGKYTYKIDAKDMKGNEFKVETKIDGRVTGVTSSQGVVFLLVGDQRIGLSDVETIKESPAPGAAPEAPKPLFGAAPANAGAQAASAASPAATEGDSSADSESGAKKASVAVSEDAERALKGDNPGSRVNDMMPFIYGR